MAAVQVNTYSQIDHDIENVQLTLDKCFTDQLNVITGATLYMQEGGRLMCAGALYFLPDRETVSKTDPLTGSEVPYGKNWIGFNPNTGTFFMTATEPSWSYGRQEYYLDGYLSGICRIIGYVYKRSSSVLPKYFSDVAFYEGVTEDTKGRRLYVLSNEAYYLNSGALSTLPDIISVMAGTSYGTSRRYTVKKSCTVLFCIRATGNSGSPESLTLNLRSFFNQSSPVYAASPSDLSATCTSTGTEVVEYRIAHLNVGFVEVQLVRTASAGESSLSMHLIGVPGEADPLGPAGGLDNILELL